MRVHPKYVLKSVFIPPPHLDIRRLDSWKSSLSVSEIHVQTFPNQFQSVSGIPKTCFVVKTESKLMIWTVKWLVKQWKFTILTWFCLSEHGFDMVVSKDPRQQSTKVEKSKIQYLSFTKHQKLSKNSSWVKSYVENNFPFFFCQKKPEIREESESSLY